MTAPKEIIKKLQWWLRRRFRGTFKNCGDTLKHGLQEDGMECGIVTPNTAAHEVFHDTLLACDRKVLERVNWFCMLWTAHVEDVRS
jgi:hypothetical protein